MSEIWNLRSAISQIEQCGFECEAGPLSQNVAWEWLRAVLDGPQFRIGQRVPHIISAEVDGFELSRAVMLTIVAIRMGSTADGLSWSYDLSKDPPAAYHYGSGVTAANVAESAIQDAIAKLGGSHDKE